MQVSDLYLRFLANEGLNRKVVPNFSKEDVNRIYIPRLRMELDIFQKVGISDYFLILHGISKFCRTNNIPTGPGRGSAAGCLTSYLTDITMIDPIPYNLIFERFYNAGRMESRTLPDIDFDVSQEHRDRVINEYIIPTYGMEYVAPIGTVGTLQSKGAVKDVGRVLGIPINHTEDISDQMGVKRGIVEKLEDALNEMEDGKYTPRAQKLQDYRKMYPELFKWIPIIESMEVIRTESVHAAGIIIAPTPVGDFVPLRWNPKKKLACTSYDMYELEDTGALKMDVLGIRNLDVIQNTLTRAGYKKTYHEFMETMTYEDPKVWQLLQKGFGIGVFQFESPFMRGLLKDVRPECIEDLSAINALGRPGPLDARFEVLEEQIIYQEDGTLPPFLKSRMRKNKEGENTLNMIEVYIARKRKELKTIYEHPLLEPILNNTYGVIVYQEQVMRIATDFAKFSLSEAAILMKIVGKKQVDKMPGQHDAFVNGCKGNGISEDVAEMIWEQVRTFAEYGFNKCIAAGTEIITKSGLKKVEDVQIGDEVLSLASGSKLSDNRYVWKAVLNVTNTGMKPCVGIETECGFRHISTRDHRIGTLEGLRSAGSLAVGEEVITPHFIPTEFKKGVESNNWNAVLAALLLSARARFKYDDEDIYTFAHENIEIVKKFKAWMSVKKIESSDIYFKSLTHRCDVSRKDIPEELKPLLNPFKLKRPLDMKDWSLTEVMSFLAMFFMCTIRFDKAKTLFTTMNPEITHTVRMAGLRFGRALKVLPMNQYESERCYLIGSESYARFEKHFLKYLREDQKQKYQVRNRKNCFNTRVPGVFLDRIQSTFDCGECQTYDIEVEGKYDFEKVYFASGLLTHNSHSISYSIIAYITAYLKVHYPAEFMASLISSDEADKRQLWIHDAKENLRIEVVPPDVNLSEHDFLAKDKKLIFGLKEIKGMGVVAARSILSERRKGGPFKSLRDFYARINLTEINSGRVKALVFAGALKCLHENHNEIIEWDAAIRDAASKSKGKVERRHSNIEELTNALNKDDDWLIAEYSLAPQKKALISGKKSKDVVVGEIKTKLQSKLDEIKNEIAELSSEDVFSKLVPIPPMNLEQILTHEEEVLGIKLSGTVASPYVNEITMYGTTTVADVKDENYEGGRTQFCGVLSDIRKHTVQSGFNKGRNMCFAKFHDLTGTMDFTVFTKQFEQFGKLLVVNKPLIIEGRLSDKKDSILCIGIKEI